MVKFMIMKLVLIRRLAGLLYISDVDSGNARKKALNKIQVNNDLYC